MKGRFFNTDFLLAVVTGGKSKKPNQQETLQCSQLLHSLMLAKRRERTTNAQPMYRSVTAMIH